MNPPSHSRDRGVFSTSGDALARGRYREPVDAESVDTESDGIYRLGSDLRFLAVNDAFAATTGYSQNELLEQHSSIVFDGDDIERLTDEISRQRDSLAPTPLELSVHSPEGEPIDCVVRLSLLSTDTGVQESLGVVHPVDNTHLRPYDSSPGTSKLSLTDGDTEERHDRHMALESEGHRVFERISDGFFTLDGEWRITYLNERAAEILEVAPEEANGQIFWELFPEAVDSRFHQQYLRAMSEHESISFEEYFAPLNSSFQVSVYPSATGVSAYVRDVTEQRARQQAVRERDQALTAHKEYIDDVVDTIDDLFYVVDSEGRLQQWNERTRSTTGYSDDEIEAMDPLDFFVEEDRERVAEDIATSFNTGDNRVEAPIRTKRGERVPMEFVASAIETPGDEPVIAGIGRDISERKQRQQQLEASNERLEQFAYAASHDLQEPLRMISSYLRLIEERYGDVLDDDGEEFLEFAIDGADRMREMIDGLLAYSRIESAGDSFESVDLNDTVADVRKALHLLCEEHHAEITVAPLPNVTGDRGQLRQLFQNLMENALTNSGDAPPRIRISAERDDSAERDGEWWLLSVRDEGIGIDPADADRIFEVFQSLDGPDENGSGIGLALCKRIVERHGGDIWVDSSVSEGATFSFTLPVDGDDSE